MEMSLKVSHYDGSIRVSSNYLLYFELPGNVRTKGRSYWELWTEVILFIRHFLQCVHFQVSGLVKAMVPRGSDVTVTVTGVW